MWKEELEYHSPGPSPVDVIIRVDNSCPNTVKGLEHNFSISQISLWSQNLEEGLFNFIYFSAVCASVCLSVITTGHLLRSNDTCES